MKITDSRLISSDKMLWDVITVNWIKLLDADTVEKILSNLKNQTLLERDGAPREQRSGEKDMLSWVTTINNIKAYKKSLGQVVILRIMKCIQDYKESVRKKKYIVSEKEFE